MSGIPPPLLLLGKINACNQVNVTELYVSGNGTFEVPGSGIFQMSNESFSQVSVAPAVEVPVDVCNSKKRRSAIWNHFSVVENGTEKGKCAYCSTVLSYKGGSTNNFARHLKTKHPTVLDIHKQPNETQENVDLGDSGERQSEGGTTAQREHQGFKKKEMGKKRSIIWNHFSILDSEEEKAKCAYCSLVVSYRGGSTANFLRHLKVKHAAVLTENSNKRPNKPQVNLDSRTKRTKKTKVNVDSEESDEWQSEYKTTSEEEEEEEQPSEVLISKGTKKKRSTLWNYFSETGKDKAKCVYCSAVLSYKGGSTANFIRHIKAKHPKVLDSRKRPKKAPLNFHSGDSDERQSEGETAAEQEEQGVSKKKNMAKRSAVWNHFTAGKSNAKCAHCSAVLVFKGSSTSTFRRHLQLKHPGVLYTRKQPQNTRVNLDSGDSNDERDGETTAGRELERPRQPSRLASFNKPLSVSQSRTVDEQIVRMVVKEYHPFSIVEDTEFQKLIEMLNPGYKLPSRKTLSNCLIPQLVEKTKETVKKHLKSASAVSITTDIWTLISNERYMTVTVNFIDEKCVLRSFLLDCFECRIDCTAENLVEEIERVLTEWNIHNKLVAVVSDNASMTKAAVGLGKWNHISCFAHSINLVVQNAIKEIHEVHEKVRTIVEYFKGSTDATNELKSTQKQMECPEVKLKQDFPGKWRSTYDMFLRILKTKNPLSSAVEMLQATLPQLTPEDWTLIEKACEILKIFYEVTEEMCGDKLLTVSKVMLLSNAMKACTLRFLEEFNDLPSEINKMVQQILDQIASKFMNVEELPLLSESTLLDPRFKRHAFKQEDLFKDTCGSVAEMASSIHIPGEKAASTSDVSPEKKAKSLIWEEFETKMTNTCAYVSTTAAGAVELDKYLQESYIDRTADPLKWWESRKSIYPRLFHVVKRRLCVVATTVPCERIFSKRGQLISERRNMLTSAKVSQIMFLNGNL